MIFNDDFSERRVEEGTRGAGEATDGSDGNQGCINYGQEDEMVSVWRVNYKKEVEIVRTQLSL